MVGIAEHRSRLVGRMWYPMTADLWPTWLSRRVAFAATFDRQRCSNQHRIMVQGLVAKENQMRLFHYVVAGTLILLMVPATSQGQYRGPSRGGDGGRSFDPSAMLRGMDANRNGMIDPSELNMRSSGFIRRAAERAGLDMKQPMAIDKLAAAMQQSREERPREEDRQRGDDRRRDEGRRDEERRSDRNGLPGPMPGANGNTSLVKTTGPAPTPGVVGFGTPIASSPGPGSLDQRYDPKVVAYVD